MVRWEEDEEDSKKKSYKYEENYYDKGREETLKETREIL